MKYILSLETSGNTCGVAISNGSEILADYSIFIINQHDRLLADLVNRIFEDTRLDINQLTAVAVSAGPGSFTGLRIGAALAKGLCYGGKPKFIAVPTLSAFAYHSIDLAILTNSRRIIAGISSHKDMMYYQVFSYNSLPDDHVSTNHNDLSLQAETDIMMIRSDDFIKILKQDDLICGYLNKDIGRAKRYETYNKLSPSIIAEYAWYMYQNDVLEDPDTFKPLYIQEFVPRGFKQT
jgi:tRNA threonylcarbamoyl adenosine modification protein YeaZ